MCVPLAPVDQLISTNQFNVYPILQESARHFMEDQHDSSQVISKVPDSTGPGVYLNI